MNANANPARPAFTPPRFAGRRPPAIAAPPRPLVLWHPTRTTRHPRRSGNNIGFASWSIASRPRPIVPRSRTPKNRQSHALVSAALHAKSTREFGVTPKHHNSHRRQDRQRPVTSLRRSAQQHAADFVVRAAQAFSPSVRKPVDGTGRVPPGYRRVQEDQPQVQIGYRLFYDPTTWRWWTREESRTAATEVIESAPASSRRPQPLRLNRATGPAAVSQDLGVTPSAPPATSASDRAGPA